MASHCYEKNKHRRSLTLLSSQSIQVGEPKVHWEVLFQNDNMESDLKKKHTHNQPPNIWVTCEHTCICAHVKKEKKMD